MREREKEQILSFSYEPEVWVEERGVRGVVEVMRDFLGWEPQEISPQEAEKIKQIGGWRDIPQEGVKIELGPERGILRSFLERVYILWGKNGEMVIAVEHKGGRGVWRGKAEGKNYGWCEGTALLANGEKEPDWQFLALRLDIDGNLVQVSLEQRVILGEEGKKVRIEVKTLS